MPPKPCEECGNPMGETAKVCPKCGAKVSHASLLLKLVPFFLLAIVVVAASLASKKPNIPAPAMAVADTTPAAPPAIEQPTAPVVNWSYENYEDSMGRGKVKTASVMSINEINFEFPYQGPQRAMLMLRTRPKSGKDVILSMQKGQFLCGIEGCTVSVRFDEGKVEEYSAAEPEDHSSEIQFIHNYNRFLTGLRQSGKVSIEAEFFHEGNRVFEFDTTGLIWGEAPVAEKK